MSHSYNLRSKKIVPRQIDQMNKEQLCAFMVKYLKRLEDTKNQKNQDILNLFYAATLMLEKKFTSSQDFLTQILVKLNHAITLVRFSVDEKMMLTNYQHRIYNITF